MCLLDRRSLSEFRLEIVQRYSEVRITERTEVWPNGMPIQNQRAERSRRVAADDIQLFAKISGDEFRIGNSSLRLSETR